MGRSLLRVGDLVNRCLTYVPVALLVLLALLAAWMRLILDRWPVTYRDDPRGLVATVLSATTVYLLVVAVVWTAAVGRHSCMRRCPSRPPGVDISGARLWRCSLRGCRNQVVGSARFHRLVVGLTSSVIAAFHAQRTLGTEVVKVSRDTAV